MFADGAEALAEGGAMILVVRKQQGAPSAKTYLETLFTDVERIARDDGYWVLRCERPRRKNRDIPDTTTKAKDFHEL